MAKLKKILSIIAISLIALVLICNLYIIISKKVTGKQNATVFGFSAAVVLSGSMEPEFSVDDMVITKKCDSYEVGDIIMFETATSNTTHRIKEITDKGFITQGDANNAPDQAPVNEEQIVGRVITVIPNAGRVIGFFQSPFGMLLLLLVLFAIVFLPSYIRNKD